MPTRPAAPNVAKHQLMWLREGVDWHVTTIRVEHAAAITQPMVDADRAAFRAWATNNWRARSDNGIRLHTIKSWSLDTAVPTKFADDPVYPLTNIVGTSNGRYTPSLCPVISMRTGLAADFPKPPAGRVWHPGWALDNSGTPKLEGDGRIEATERAALIACWDALRAAFTNVPPLGRIVIVSYWDGGTRDLPVLRGAPLLLPWTRTYTPDYPSALRSRRPRQQAYVTN